MQIEIYNPAQGQPLPAVEWNYPEVKKWLEDGLAGYKGRVYTDATINEAKKDRAALNKLADAIDSKRKEMKAMYLKPYEEFEKQAKELTAMVKEHSAAIDAQVKAYDEARRQDKLEKVKVLYASMIGNLAGLVPYERLHNPKWLNVSVSMSTISEELGRSIDKIEAGLISIDKLGLDADIAEQVKGVFLKNYDLAAALAEKERIEKQREELARYEAAKAAVKETVQAAMPQEPVRPPVSVPVEDDEIILEPITFKVYATRAQLAALKHFLKSNNIKYGRA